jgi:hypothetical protein
LVDRYYVARSRWSGSLVRAHAEHNQEFGDPADRNYEYPHHDSARVAGAFVYDP